MPPPVTLSVPLPDGLAATVTVFAVATAPLETVSVPVPYWPILSALPIFSCEPAPVSVTDPAPAH